MGTEAHEVHRTKKLNGDGVFNLMPKAREVPQLTNDHNRTRQVRALVPTLQLGNAHPGSSASLILNLPNTRHQSSVAADLKICQRTQDVEAEPLGL